VNLLELRVFHVGHGLSVALIEKPENYVTLIDLGAETGWTPLKFMHLTLKVKPDVLYITHPHADHLDDVETALDESFRPLKLYYEDYDWKDVKGREKKELAHKIDDFLKLQKKVEFGSYAGNADLKCWHYAPEVAKKEFGDATYVNNSSLFFVYKWIDFKIAIAGDLESDGISGMVGTQGVQDDAKGTYILIPSHHGHTNGFPAQWVEKMGKPHVSIISAQERDKNVDSRYNSANFAQGVSFEGKTRYSLTTRTDGNILVSMWNDLAGKATWKFESF
jgi:beta-lactamase superfamily II metal-dependent hydrolase